MHICGREKTIRTQKNNNHHHQERTNRSKVTCQYTSPESLRQGEAFHLSIRVDRHYLPRRQISAPGPSSPRPHPGKALVLEDHYGNVFIMSPPVTSQPDSGLWRGVTGLQVHTQQALQTGQSCHRTAHAAFVRGEPAQAPKGSLVIQRSRREEVKGERSGAVGRARAWETCAE